MIHIIFILKEIPYPPNRNGVALINFELLKRAPKDMSIDLLITGPKEDIGPVDILRSHAPAINDIFFTDQAFTRNWRLGNLISGILFGRNVLSQSKVRKYLFERKDRADLFYVAPLIAGVDFWHTRPLFLNAVDSLARFNENAYLHSGMWIDKAKTFMYRLYESRMLRAAMLTNFVSSLDLEYVQIRNPNLPIVNFTNGVDSDIFKPNDERRVSERLLFTGNFDYVPNAQAAQYLVHEIFPRVLARRPNATLFIVGRNPPLGLNNQPGVMVTGFVEDIVPYYQAAEIFVCPLLSGAGIKNKVLEALSAGLPIVTTSIGIDGIEHIEENRHYLLADDPEIFSIKVLMLLENTSLRSSMANEARDVAEKDLGWDPIVNNYYDAMRDVAAVKKN